MGNFEIKAKIVLSGNSSIFKNWQSLLPNLSEEMFLSSLKWVCEDPNADSGKLTREIGLTKIGIVKLIRHQERCGTVFRYEDGRLWNGDVFRVPCSNPDYADADGMINDSIKLSLSARDKV